MADDVGQPSHLRKTSLYSRDSGDLSRVSGDHRAKKAVFVR